jgi:AbiV family abortive infection protein
MGHEVLLQGSYYALHLAGELLEEAQILVEQSRYPRTVFLAIHAFEELGRSKRLLEFARQASEGESVTREMVVRALDNHVAKHRWGRGSITVEANSDT